MIRKIAKEIANEYFQDTSIDLHEAIAKEAQRRNWNANQVKIASQGVNSAVIAKLQRDVAGGLLDPHFSFPTVKVAKVIEIISPKSMSGPSLPEKNVSSPSLVTSFNPALRDRSKETGFNMKDKIMGIGYMTYLRDKLKEKCSRLKMMQLKLDSMIQMFEKQAEQKIINGTPVEVFDALPTKDITDKTQEKLAQYNWKLTHIDREFEIDEQDPLVKMAFEIEKTQSEIDEFSQEVDKMRDIIAEKQKEYEALTWD